MDDDTLHTQRMEIEKCITELGETLLSEPSGVSGFSKIVHDVHKVIKHFIQLGNYYGVELRKKCNELEIKNREIKELSWKLQQVQLEGGDNAGQATVFKPDLNSNMIVQQPRDRDAECLNTDKSSNEVGMAKEQLGKLAASNGSFSQLLKDQTQFHQLSWHEPNLPKSFLLMSSKQSASPSEGNQEPLRMESEGIDQGPTGYKGPNLYRESSPVMKSVGTQVSLDNPTPRHYVGQDIIQDNGFQYLQSSLAPNLPDTSCIPLGVDSERSKAVNNLTLHCRNGTVDDFPSSDHGDPHVGCHKRQLQFTSPDNESEEKRCTFIPLSKSRRADDRQGVDLLSSEKMKKASEITQQRLVQEQTHVESLSNLVENYQHKFLEKSAGSRITLLGAQLLP